MKDLFSHKIILMEAAIVERLRRSDDLDLHPTLINAPLIYDDAGKKALTNIYQEYTDIAKNAKSPIMLSTPTWRANHLRVTESSHPLAINIDAVNFLLDFRYSQKEAKSLIKIGGLIGCKNDCYKPEESLSTFDSQKFHTWQVEQLTQGGVDYLIAVTLPSVTEALGIAHAMEGSELPYILSFVIDRQGFVLDGSSLLDAIQKIDSSTTIKPTGYMVNCAFPSFICPDSQDPELFKRLIGYQANASSLDHCDLDNSEKLKTDDLAQWGDLMLELHHKYGMKLLGGCCGTNGTHLHYIANRL